MPVDSQGFLREHKDNPIEGMRVHRGTLRRVSKYLSGIVEQVRDGSTLRIRLLLPNSVHQMVNISMAGVRCAKATGKDGEPAEPWGEEV
jgi:staphylococcal nuclease domain-containing protein 1